jgi:glycosyltransferase involved in cell wall biosynthesis
MVERPELIAFAQYRLGGVQNFYYNILSHLPVGLFDLLWILDDPDNADNAKLPELYGICKEMIFKSDLDTDKTIYDRFKRLAQNISNRPGLVVTNFYLELGMLHVHRRKNKTIYFVCHDVLYLQQAVEYEFLIDVFIAHNPQFYHALVKEFPHRANDIYYLPYGVNIPDYKRIPCNNEVLNIVFAARLVKEKGVLDLEEIVNQVEGAGARVNWTIMGNGPYKETLETLFAGKQNIRFCNPVTNEEVRQIMSQHDIFILPSYLDGLPVAMLEAMSVGLVPVIYKFNEGITQVLTPAEGMIVPSGNKNEFACCIIELYNDKSKLERMSENCRKKAEEEYDIQLCVKKYTALFLRYKELKKPVRRKFIAYGGLLEQPIVPSFVRNGIRKLKKKTQ